MRGATPPGAQGREEERMGVPCPSCGRDYDVALFQFGRTIDCTCGRRVGVDAPRRVPVDRSNPRFLADAMLGRLARWLRVVGCDTAWEAHVDDAALVRRAIQEERVLISRDRGLAEEWRVPQLLLLSSEDALEQLREVFERFPVDWRAGLFTRCTVCNENVQPVEASTVADEVPPGVRGEQQRFTRCPGCNRVYWAGSHTDHMRQLLEEALGS